MASVSRKILSSGALTATTTSAAQSMDSKSKSFVAYLSVTSSHAATTTDASIEHSPDGTNWFVVASFANIAGTTGSELVYQAAFTGLQVLSQVRAVIILTGATQEATVEVALCFDADK